VGERRDRAERDVSAAAAAREREPGFWEVRRAKETLLDERTRRMFQTRVAYWGIVRDRQCAKVSDLVARCEAARAQRDRGGKRRGPEKALRRAQLRRDYAARLVDDAAHRLEADRAAVAIIERASTWWRAR
jgi:hypothetical protein